MRRAGATRDDVGRCRSARAARAERRHGDDRGTAPVEQYEGLELMTVTRTEELQAWLEDHHA
ncbi:hypothetical protein ACFVDH_40080, partial [Streptomyces sp. NPDC057674]|uniref:hypothetical protein n=1 Tax=Streptomyces sp. NPDC057674 TaxID=3346203 RepID=UPI0036C27C42